MKLTKRILSIALALVLVLGLAMPAVFAQEVEPQSTVNWDEFMFSKRPQNITIRQGDSFTLSAEVRVPNGVAEVTYQWYYFSGTSRRIEGATTHELRLGPDSPFYPQYERLGGASAIFIVGITAYEKDGGGDVVSSRTLQASAIVSTERTSLGRLYDLTIMPFVQGFGAVVALTSMTMGLLLPFAQIIFIGGLIFAYIQSFIGLFR